VSQAPRAFRLDRPDVVSRLANEPEVETQAATILVTEEPMEAVAAADGVPVLPKPRRRAPWLGLFVSALGALVSLAAGIALERFIVGLFDQTPWLGWTAIGLAALALFALLGLVGRELTGVFRERRLERLRQRATEAIAIRDHVAARTLARELHGLYGAGRHRGGPGVLDVDSEIIDADDRLGIAERTLVAPLDEQAKAAIGAAAKQVSVVTALSPRAVVDVAFVVYAAARLLGRIARIYGARPGFLGSLRLARAALNHLAVTGGVAVGDSLMHQVLGLGLAARISAKLGEGAVNGLMTARFGLAALEVCRPLPFIREMPPRIADVAGEILAGIPGMAKRD
jgi:putative membrane protein